MPDRLPSLVLLAGFWVPPAIAGWTAARFAERRAPGRPSPIYTVLTILVLAWALAWFLFQLDKMPPYIPGAVPEDPAFAPPEAVAGLAVVASALVLPGSAIACALAFRRARKRLTNEALRPG